MSKLERYHVQEPLGEGGMGSVFKAWDTQLQRAVAIKFFTDFDPNDPDQAKRIQQEAVNHAALQHPNIVTLFDHGVDGNRAFAVMELVEGETLHHIVQRERLTLEVFRDVAAQCLEALNAAHKIGMLHRDLKALNVMLAPKIGAEGYRVKLLDFGLSKKLKKPEIQTTDQEEGLLGSIHSMAPEQFDRKPIDQRTDLYAMGCLFYYALVGRFPFDGESPADIMVAHLRHFVRPLHLRRPDAPRALADWVMRFIEQEPANRHRSAWAALEELRKLNHTPVEPQETRQDLVKRALPHLIAIPAITIVAIALIAMPLWKKAFSNAGEASAGPVTSSRTAAAEDGMTTVSTAPLLPEHPAGEPYAPSQVQAMALVGQDTEVTVRGAIQDFMPGDEAKPRRRLRFAGPGPKVGVLVEADPDTISDEDLENLVGMEVEIRGFLTGRDANMRLTVTDFSQIDVMGEAQ